MDLHENLKGKTVVITGGSGILCREFAYAYAKQGMNVAVLGRTLSKLEEVRDKINELGGNGLAVVCDVVDKDSVINAKKVVTVQVAITQKVLQQKNILKKAILKIPMLFHSLTCQRKTSIMYLT